MTLDLSDYSTAAGAAKALHEFLTDTFDADATLYRPEENPRDNGAWAVNWDGGPYEWPIHLTGGESLAYSDLPGPMRPGSPEVTGFYETGDWTAEPHFKHDLQFFDN